MSHQHFRLVSDRYSFTRARELNVCLLFGLAVVVVLQVVNGMYEGADYRKTPKLLTVEEIGQ